MITSVPQLKPKQLPQLRQVLGTNKSSKGDIDRGGVAGSTAYTPKAGDENKFMRFHKVQKNEVRIGVKSTFHGSGVKAFDRVKNRFGYNPDKDSMRGEFSAHNTPPEKDAASAINPAPVVIVKGIAAGTSGGEGNSFGEEFTPENILEDTGREQFLKIRGVSYEKYQQMTPNEKSAFNREYHSWAIQARKIKKEEVQLDEISKALAGRYIKKSVDSAAAHSYADGVKMTGGKSSIKPPNKGSHFIKTMGRINGVKQATDKLTGAAKVGAT